MGVEYHLICWDHRESLRMGKLREREEMVRHFLRYPRTKIPKYLTSADKDLISAVKNFKTRHKGCTIALINDHMDLDDALCIPLNDEWHRPLPTREDFVKYAESKAIPMHYGSFIEYFVNSHTAYKWGAKDRKIKIKFKKHVKKEKELIGIDHEFDPSYDVYEGEDGLIYHVYNQWVEVEG